MLNACRAQTGGAIGRHHLLLVEADAARPDTSRVSLHQRPDEEETSFCRQGVGERDAGAGAETERATE